MKSTLLSKRSLAFALIAFALAMVAETQFASAVPITVQAAAPAVAPIDIRNTTGGSDSDMVRRVDNSDPNQHQWFGQTFTVPVGGMTVDKVAYRFAQEDADDREDDGMTMGALIYNASTLADLTGTTVTSQSGVTPVFTKGTTLWMIIDIADTALAAGTYGINFDFAFALNPQHKIGGSGAGMHFATSENYAGGAGWRQGGLGGSNTIGGTDHDLVFAIMGYETVNIPEPSTFALAGLGLVGAIAARRRRRS